jgi:hypothetical protein
MPTFDALSIKSRQTAYGRMVLRGRSWPEAVSRVLRCLEAAFDPKRTLLFEQRMNSDKVKSWLTLGANLGVLVGIVLLLIELDQNSDLMRAQIVQERANHLVQKYEANIHSDYWPRIAAEIRDAENPEDVNIDSLPPEDYQRVLNLYYREVNDLRNQHYQYREGFLPEEIWEVSSRGQARRLIFLAIALDRLATVRADHDFGRELRRIAAEEGITLPDISDSADQ